jgi:cobalamin biosynthesis protein CobD/CbiB
MVKAVQPHKLTHKQVVRIAWGCIAVIMAVEACAVCHFYVSQQDVWAAIVVVTTWFKEGIRSLVEHIAEHFL